jgi:putative membrane protein insertion efficiency factor
MSEGVNTVPSPKPVSLARRIGMLPVRLYRVTLAWLLGGHCRFTPSCSVYALEAIEKHGVLRGWWLAVCRICRCHPFCKGGYDPVPCESNCNHTTHSKD